MKKIIAALCVLTSSFNLPAQNTGRSLQIISSFRQTAFPLVHEGNVPAILVDSSDAYVVRITAEALASDLQLLSGTKPSIVSNRGPQQKYLIIAGTIGQSSVIDDLIAGKKFDVSKIRSKWESFIIATVDAPMKGVKQALVIAGSDPRGTAYGLFEISHAAGISPWIWWADVLPAKQKNLSVLPAIVMSNEPSVKYRGIFLNDEDWGLQPWAAKTFEPETGDIGPKTYAKLFELLLRLRANLIWPAMHESTKAFFHYTGNAKVAADYSIIVGSSHAEPMLRNNVGEWDEKTMGHFNYITNKETVYKYWEERVKQSSGINGMYTLGMRGVHDSRMEGIKDDKEAVPLLENIFKDQRELLTRYINKNITDIPQVFTAYKEVLDIYDNGLKLPDDVTLVWPDDNYGYIQRLNNEFERRRNGGSGVYYHISYWGRPHDYLWINSTNPSLVREEMMKAFENNSNRLWVVNVGDLKPGEYATQMFMDMAYDTEPFKNTLYPKQHLLKWLTNIFGPEYAREMLSVMSEYYQLAFERKPEFMGWSQTEPTTKTNYTTFNHFFYGDEAQKRIDDYSVLEQKVKALRGKINSRNKAAFYQLIYYPVVGASLMNKKFLYRDKSYFYSLQNRASAADYAQMSKAAYDSIMSETNYYNNQLSDGKWKNMMSMKPRDLPVFLEPELPSLKIDKSDVWDVAPEGFENGEELQPLVFDKLNRQKYFIDVFLNDDTTIEWKASASERWIRLSKSSGKLSPEFGKRQERIYVSVDWNMAPKTSELGGDITFGDGERERFVVVLASNLKSTNNRSFIENNGYVSMHAVHYTRQVKKISGRWFLLAGIGYSAEVLKTQGAALKDTANFRNTKWIKANSSYVEYDFQTFTSANATLTVFSLPTHPLNNAFSMRYAVSVDDGPLQLVDFRTFGRSEEWKQNVLRNRAERKIQMSFLDKGMHHLRIYSVDPGVILDEILLDLGGLKNAYDNIPETKVVSTK